MTRGSGQKGESANKRRKLAPSQSQRSKLLKGRGIVLA
jgi:hypothetical protein